MTLMPAMLLTLISVGVNVIAIPIGMINDAAEMGNVFKVLCQTLLSFYTIFMLLGAITTFTEWNNIHCSKRRKILYLFTFPVFMMTYIPISVIALFRKVEWKPIKHNVAKSVEDICNNTAVK